MVPREQPGCCHFLFFSLLFLHPSGMKIVLLDAKELVLLEVQGAAGSTQHSGCIDSDTERHRDAHLVTIQFSTKQLVVELVVGSYW